MLPDLSLSLGRGSSFGLNALNNAARAPQRTMTPEEEDSIAWKVGRAGISGLAGIGNLLDLPVSSVRDTLAGENPFDQWLTPFSDTNRVSARDLLRRNGMIGQEDTWGNFFGGMAVDYALDPMTYLSFGTSAMAKAALTKGGKIFQRIGGTAGDVAQLTAKGVGPRIGLGTTTLKAFLEHGDDAAKLAKKADALEAAAKLGYSLDDDILNQPLRQMGGWGIPFTEIGGTFGDLTKPGVARGIAYGMDAIGEAVKYSAPGRFARMLFDPDAGGFLDESSQKLHAMKYGEKNRAAALAAKNATESGKVINEAFAEFRSAYGDQIDDMLEEGDDPLVKALDLFNRVSRFTSETGDYDEALKLMDLNPVEDVAMRKWATKLNDVLGDPAQANAMTAVWKGFAEGYLGEKAGKWMDENIENIRKSSLSQVQGEAPRALFQGNDLDDLVFQEAPLNQLNDAGGDYWSRWRSSLSDDEAAAIEEWTGQNFGKINQVMRGKTYLASGKEADLFAGVGDGIGGMTAEQAAAASGRIASALERARTPEAMTVFRRVSRKELESLAPGRSFVDQGFVAASRLSDPSSSLYGKHVGNPDIGLMEIEVPKGAKAADLFGMGGNFSRSESEVLLAPGTKFVVDGVEQIPGSAGVQLKAKLRAVSPDQPLYQGEKGATQFLEDGKAVVSIFQNADITTHLHEFSHVARRHLTPKDLEIASKWVGAAGDWAVEHEEKWAKGFEEFMRSGNLPEAAPAEIKGIFQRLQAWVVGIYKSLTGTQQADQIPAEIKELYGRIIGTRSRAGVEGKVRTAGEMMQQMNREAFMRLHEMGGTGSLLPDIEGTDFAPGFKHVERYLSPEIARALSPNKPPRLGRMSFGSQMGRNEVIRTVPTEIVNQILDSDVMRTTPTGDLDAAAAEISRKFGNYLGRDEAFGFDPSKPLQGQVLDKSGHARALAEWASNHRKGRMFNNSRMDDFIKYQQGAQAQLKMYEVIHSFLEKNTLNDGSEGVTVRQAFRDAGMDSERAIKWRWKTKGAGGDTLEKFSKNFGDSRVPVEVAAAIKAIQEPFRQADWMRTAGKFMDDVVNGTFKGMFTLPFPAFHGRNLIQGQYMNLAASGHIKTANDVAEYASTLKDVMRQWQTGAAEAQTLAEEMTAWGALDKRSIAEGIETTGSAYRGVSAGPRSPLTDLAGSWRAADERIGQIQQDWPTPPLDAIPGVTRARVAGQTIMEEGGKLAAVTEWANRATLFSYLRKKGFTAEAAASEVRKMHADYGDLAPFEKVVMRRLVPFYAFQRRMAPVMFETLLDSPSGGLGQTIRALRQSRDDEDALMPDHVAQTTAIPLGGSEDGSKKYLTGFGFPFEQSLAYFDGGVRGGLREAASQLTPLVKAPLEYASGQTFFQAGSGGAGRSLNDLDPTVGRTLSNILGQADPVDIGRTNEFILANSPLSRFLTVGRKLSDPRKSAAEKLASIGLGINTTDVSIAAQDAVLRDRASDFMREQGARSYERVYFPSWQIDQMENPAAQQQAQDLNALQAVLSSRARRRAEAKQKNPLLQAAGR